MNEEIDIEEIEEMEDEGFYHNTPLTPNEMEELEESLKPRK